MMEPTLVCSIPDRCRPYVVTLLSKYSPVNLMSSSTFCPSTFLPSTFHHLTLNRSSLNQYQKLFVDGFKLPTCWVVVGPQSCSDRSKEELQMILKEWILVFKWCEKSKKIWKQILCIKNIANLELILVLCDIATYTKYFLIEVLRMKLTFQFYLPATSFILLVLCFARFKLSAEIWIFKIRRFLTKL